MTSQLQTTARTAATALMRGTFQERPLAACLWALRGRRTKALRHLAAALVQEFGAGRRPRQRQVAAFLLQRADFCRAFGRDGLHLDHLRAARMQPAAGAPATWQLPSLCSVAALAQWLEIEPAELQALRAAWRARGESESRCHYHHRWVARRHGPPRLIEAPKARLKAVQRRILDGILQHIPPHELAHGFVKGRSTTGFVRPHCQQVCVLRLDVQDFFASLRRPRVLRVFLTAGYPEDVAGALADLCTTRTPASVAAAALAEGATALRQRLAERHLPQGAPTSPALANHCAYAMDARLSGLARRFGASYTRYADDLLFSGGATFARDAGRCEVRIAAVLLECGLQVAHHKTRVMRRSVAQRAAGLVINEHPAVPRRERKQLEAILVNCVRQGPALQNREAHPDFRAHLQGRIAQVAHLHPAAGERLRCWFARIAWHSPPDQATGGTGGATVS